MANLKLGFTTREIEDSEAFTATAVLSENDTRPRFLDSVPVHPFYRKQRWQVPFSANLARYPFGDGNEYVYL
jgi:hypothetical protein